MCNNGEELIISKEAQCNTGLGELSLLLSIDSLIRAELSSSWWLHSGWFWTRIIKAHVGTTASLLTIRLMLNRYNAAYEQSREKYLQQSMSACWSKSNVWMATNAKSWRNKNKGKWCSMGYEVIDLMGRKVFSGSRSFRGTDKRIARFMAVREALSKAKDAWFIQAI